MKLLSVILKNLSPQLLSARSVGGFFGLLFIFAFCFFGIHILRYAKIGWDHRNEAPPAPPEEKPAEKEKAPAEPPPQEPVYYIVEKKQRRAKAQYGEPKQIHFK